MCLSPKTFKQGKEFITVPCGRCVQCIIKKKRDWEIRITQESYVSDLSFFSLISYNPEHLPNPDLPDKRALQLFIKQLRVNLNRPWKVDNPLLPYKEYDTTQFRKDKSKPIRLKYFIVSEYGEKRNRLHYHAIFFLYNVDATSLDRFFWKAYLEILWGKGFCSAFYLDPRTIRYACKYIQKSYNMMMYSRLGKDAYLEFQKGKDFPIDKPPLFQLKGKGFLPPRSWQEGIMLQNRGVHFTPDWGRYQYLKHEFDPPAHDYQYYKDLNDKHVADNPDLFNKPVVKRQNNDDLINYGQTF